MPETRSNDIIPSKGGVFQDFLLRLKLIMRLLGDNRVSVFLKLIPIGSLVYLFFPDLAPGPVDDAAIIWLGFYLFVELCPPHVVEEHMAALNQIPAKTKSGVPEEEIVDAEFREV